MSVNVGLIGCGTVAGYGHLPALGIVDGARLVAVADAVAERARAAAEKHGVPHHYADYRELLARPDVDLVVVATPPSQHCPMVLAALAAGTHVFCEKPLATNVADGEAMVRAARSAARLLAVDFESRVAPPYQRARALLDGGAIGRLRVLRLVNLWMGGRWAGEERYHMLMTDGQGPIVDCGVHAIDLARWLGRAEFADVHAVGTRVEGYENPDHVILTGRLTSGTLVLIEESWVYTHRTRDHVEHRELEALGEHGLVRYAADSGELRLYTAEATAAEPVGSAEKPFVAMYERLIASVRSGALVDDLASGDDGLAALRVALAALLEARR
jgi:predicted dehydrogenase